MKTIIVSFIVLALFIGCSENNPVGNNNNPPTLDSEIVLIKDSLIVSNSGSEGIDFADSINIPIKITFKATWQNGDNCMIKSVLVGNPVFSTVLLDSISVNIVTKNTVNTIYLNPHKWYGDRYALTIGFASVNLNGFAILYDIHAYKNQTSTQVSSTLFLAKSKFLISAI